MPGAGGEDEAVEAVEPGGRHNLKLGLGHSHGGGDRESGVLPPASSILWKIYNSPVNSSLILLQISELNGTRTGAQFGGPLTTAVRLQCMNFKREEKLKS